MKTVGGREPSATNAAEAALGGSAYWVYAAELDVLIAKEFARSSPDSPDRRIAAHLDGGAGEALRRLVPLGTRRETGAFFTPHKMAERALAALGSSWEDARIVDPACGAGDLLLAAARRLGAHQTLSETLQEWRRRFAGCDLDASFVAVAKRRLTLLALELGATPDLAPQESFALLNVELNDALRCSLLGDPQAHVILNPPYGHTQAPDGCRWATGTVARAAVFAANILEQCGAGARAAFILPDVLRSGTRYAKWRQYIAQLADIELVEPLGRFDAFTDVDVFLLTVIRGAQQSTDTRTRGWPSSPSADSAVSDWFVVSVGPVVAYRSPRLGHWKKYLTARGLGEATVQSASLPSRRFNGRVVTPPFVVVRRTSRPSLTAARVRANVVVGPDDVAVENHLIILEPRDGSSERCDDLVARLHSQETTVLLNERIRCRHLTVSALSNLPWSASS